MSSGVPAATNSWLRAQRKSELVKLADDVGMTDYKSLKKFELETALDEFIARNSTLLADRADLTGYFISRSKALGSPVKREKEDSEKSIKVTRRRMARVAAASPVEAPTSESEDQRNASSSSILTRTPGRNLSQMAAGIPLPATPADVACAVDRSAVAVRKRVSSIYQDSGITEASQATRETLSTVTSILFCVSAFELYCIRPAILANRYAFTVPAVDLFGTPDCPVYLPDMFLLLTSSFWSPALAWTLTSVVLPCLFGYFFNLSATSSTSPPGPATRLRVQAPGIVVDPLTFSIAKALVSYIVYGQGATLGGLLSPVSIERLGTAVYGGYKGILAGAAITGIVSMYDAVLRR